MERYDLSVANIEGVLPEGAYKDQGISLAIGFFDGVHLGHQEVLRQAVAAARKQGLVPAMMTFDPHPRVALGQGTQYETVLTPLEDKLKLFSELGVEAAYVVHFDLAFSQVTAEQFVNSFILPLGVKVTTVGFDFCYGHRGEGNAATLRDQGNGYIEVQVVSPVFLEGNKVSSTRVRERLTAGECSDAQELLGRQYKIKGTVIHGDARGRQLGFPTANLLTEQAYVIPRSGVYAVYIDILTDSGGVESQYNGVLNIGYRPTFDQPGGALRLEAHLLQYEGDLYGRQLAITFHTFLRAEQKFSAINELIEQIAKDTDRARSIFAVSHQK